jgi:nucleoside-diphosphate-sugar epimerase
VGRCDVDHSRTLRWWVAAMAEAPRSLYVAGGSGFVGQHLVRLAAEQGAMICASSRTPRPGMQQVPPLANLPHADAVVFLAQDSHRGTVNAYSPAQLREQLDFAAAVFDRYRAVVFASTATLYGDADSKAHEEDDPIFVTDRYAELKTATEALALARGGTVLRLANVYGPGQVQSSVMTDMIAGARKTGVVRPAIATPVRDFLFVEDLAAILHAVAQAPVAGIFNIGTGIGTSIAELARALAALMGLPFAVEPADPDKPVSAVVVDPGRARRTWRLAPFTPLSDGLRVTLERI